MEIDGFGTVAALVSAFGVGTVITALVSQGSERREARGKVLDAVRAVESARWASSSPGSLEDALRQLETAGLVARIPREATEEYAVLATAALQLSKIDFDGSDNSEGINKHFSQLVRRMARAVVEVIWHPWAARPFTRFRISRIRKDLERMDDPVAKRRVALVRKRR